MPGAGEGELVVTVVGAGYTLYGLDGEIPDGGRAANRERREKALPSSLRLPRREPLEVEFQSKAGFHNELQIRMTI